MAEEGFTFDPANKDAIKSNLISHAKATNKNIDLSLDEIVEQKKKERIEERQNRKKSVDIRLKGRSRSSPKIRVLSREGGNLRNRRTSRPFDQRQTRKSSADIEKNRPANEKYEGKETNRSAKGSNQQKAKPRQIEVPEESLRKFLRGEGIRMDKDFTYKIMSYPKE